MVRLACGASPEKANRHQPNLLRIIGSREATPNEASAIVPRPRQHGQRDLQELSTVMHSALLTMSHAEKFFKHATKAFEEEGRKMQLAVDKVDATIRMG